MNNIYIGCAGWSVPKESASRFPTQGSHLARYAARFPAVEINSSFYRPHRPATYQRWAASVPADFRFSVKVPKVITHEHRLIEVTELFARFLSDVTHLQEKLGPLLVQLPPSLPFAGAVVERFFADVRGRFPGDVALEPRHASWFAAAADRLMVAYRIARVAADPAVVTAEPGGWNGLVYYRLHGSPQVYYSSYPDEDLVPVAEALSVARRTAAVWCIFDNTAVGAATRNALDRLGLLRVS